MAAPCGYFPPAGEPAFASRGKIAGPAIEALAGEGCQPVPPMGFRRHEGREGRGQTDEGTPR